MFTFVQHVSKNYVKIYRINRINVWLVFNGKYNSLRILSYKYMYAFSFSKIFSVIVSC